MRSSLAAIQGQRCRFSAIFAGRSRRGNLILRDVVGPVGEAEHVWVQGREWATRLPTVGRKIELVGTVLPYWRDDGEKDFSLFACEEVLP